MAMAIDPIETLPDFYGPFLPAEQIKFKPEGENDYAVQLALGDYVLRVADCEPLRLQDDRRFILNALLYEPDGSVFNADLYAAGYYPDAPTPAARQLSLSRNTAGLLDDLNSAGIEVIKKAKVGVWLTINLSNDLSIVKVNDEAIGQIEQPIKIRRANSKKLEDDPLVKYGISQPVASSFRGCIFGGEDADLPDVQPTDEGIAEAKKALRLLHRDMGNDPVERENFARLSRHIVEVEALARRGTNANTPRVSLYANSFLGTLKPPRG